MYIVDKIQLTIRDRSGIEMKKFKEEGDSERIDF